MLLNAGAAACYNFALQWLLSGLLWSISEPLWGCGRIVQSFCCGCPHCPRSEQNSHMKFDNEPVNKL